MSRILRLPHLWTKGRTPELELDTGRVGMEGWFTVSLIHARSGLTVRQLRFRNLIVNEGMNLIGASNLSNTLTNFAVGASSVAPDVAQGALGAEVARTNSAGGFNDALAAWIAGNAYQFARRTRVFTEAQANGNLTEVGIFNSSGVMFCRSLLKDAAGVPTTIVKTNEFQLRIDYEIRGYPPNGWGDYSFDAPVNGVVRTLTGRPLGATNNISWNLLGFGGTPTVSSATGVNNNTFNALKTDAALLAASSTNSFNAASTAKTNTAYAPGSHYREQTQEWNGSVANDTDYFLWGWNGLQASFQVLFPVALVKNNTQKFVIVARAHWARRP